MPINITMPALSPTMEEGNLAKWLVKEGDKVSAGDVIAEIETDKATMEVEAVDEGVLAKILVDGGTEAVKVNAVIAILAEEGEDVAAAASSQPSAPQSAPPPVVAPLANGTETATAASTQPSAVKSPTIAVPDSVAPVKSGSQERIFASPLARRIAKDKGLDLSSLKGSGPHGRIIKRDVETASAGSTAGVSTSGTNAMSQSKQIASGSSTDQVLKLYEEGSYELVKHDNMRKTIASRLQQSKQTVPHFYVTMDCQLDDLLKLRAEINAAAPMVDDKPSYKVSVNDMVIKALALALRDVPNANASWSDDYMILHKHADVGVAVSIPGGLITPIVRKAETKTLSVISNEMKDFGKRAKERKLKPEEYQGGSSAVSNMGMMGVREFSAVINPPHGTILAIGAGEQRAIVKDGSIQIATVMSVTLSCDHRAVDGALGAELLGAFKRYIENPMGMLV